MNHAWRIVLLMMLQPVLGSALLASTITSALPQFYNAGQPFTIALTTTPDSGAQVQAVEDTPPTNWIVGVISHGGAFDPLTGKVKWGPFVDAQIRVLTYQVTPPANANGARSFEGKGIFDQTVVTISGVRTTQKFPGSLTRVLPPDYIPGAAVTVKLDASPAADVRAWAAEDLVPNGWSVIAISHSGVYDTLNRSVKWGPFLDALPRALAYTITPALSSRIDASFRATVVFDSAVLTDNAAFLLRPSQLTRTAPAAYVPQTKFIVTLTAIPASYVQALTIEESIAVGWTPSDITASGTWDAVNHKIKWGPFIGSEVGAKSLSYSLTPAADAVQAVSIQATAVFDERSISNDAIVSRFLSRTENSVTRSLPASYRPAQPLTILLAATPIDIGRVYAVEETIPSGWTVSTISHGGVVDAINHKAKWGPFFDAVATPRTLSYVITPPTNAFGNVIFAGIGIFDDQAIETTGQTATLNAPANVTRALPTRYNPGKPFPVTVQASPVPGIITYAVEEQIPNGWNVSSISDGGAYDPTNQKIKWGPFIDANVRPLTYTVTPPSTATGINTFAGQGLFNSDFLKITGPTTIAANHPPTTTLVTFQPPPNTAYNISVLDVLKSCSDPENDLLEIASVSPLSTRGGVVQLNWPSIIYTPPAGPAAVDRFNYVVRDNAGGTAVGTVELIPLEPPPAPKIISIELSPGGGRLIKFNGASGYTYKIQISTNLIGWTDITTRAPNNLGLFEFTDTAEIATRRFYRSAWP